MKACRCTFPRRGMGIVTFHEFPICHSPNELCLFPLFEDISIQYGIGGVKVNVLVVNGVFQELWHQESLCSTFGNGSGDWYLVVLALEGQLVVPKSRVLSPVMERVYTCAQCDDVVRLWWCLLFCFHPLCYRDI